MLEDEAIIELYWNRSEEAITETDKKYGKKCIQIARNILNDISDAEECLNDTYLTAWNQIPPKRPEHLPAYLFRVIKNHSLSRFQHLNRKKRKGREYVPYEELEECTDGKDNAEDAFDEKELVRAINDFLRETDQLKRVIFVRKYWYYDSVSQIAERYLMSEENVKITLMRTRQKLKEFLTERGLFR